MAPPWTNTWDETKPADTDLANTIGSASRQLKLDTRQRLDWQHVWNQNVNDDGGHRFVLIASSYHPVNTESWKSSGFSLTGAAANSAFDVAGTWNTSGVPTAFKLNITDTASDASSLLMDLQVGGVSKFKVDKLGNVTVTGTIGSGGAIVYASTKTATTLTVTYAQATNLAASITPSTVSKRVRICASVACGIMSSVATLIDIRITRGSGGPVVKEWIGVFVGTSSSGAGCNVGVEAVDSPATTSATTYYIEARHHNATINAFVNGQIAGSSDNPTSSISLQEVV